MFEKTEVRGGNRVVGRYKTPGKDGIDAVMDVEKVVELDGRAYLVGTVVQGMPWATGWLALRADRFLPLNFSVSKYEPKEATPDTLVMYKQMVASFGQIEDVTDEADFAAAMVLGAVKVNDVAVESVAVMTLAR